MNDTNIAFVSDKKYNTYITDPENIQEKIKLNTINDEYPRNVFTIKPGSLCIKNLQYIYQNNRQHALILPNNNTIKVFTTTESIETSRPTLLLGNLIHTVKQVKASSNIFNNDYLSKMFFGRSSWAKEIQVGSDPELFVLDETGKVVPSWTFLYKKAPGRLVYQDGYQAELYIEPAYCFEFLIDSIRDAINKLYEISKYNNPYNVVSWKTVGDCPMVPTFTDEDIQLGCKPSYNAYNLKPNLENVDPRKFTNRPIGMHIHLDTVSSGGCDPVTLTKLMDRIVGIPSVSILRGLEDKTRRNHYGLPGEYRNPKHGYEYRAISSAALLHPAVCVLHFELARMAWGIHLFQKDTAEVIIDAISDEEVIKIMRNLQVVKAKDWSQHLFGINNISIKEWQNILSPLVYSLYNTAAAFITKGVRHFIDIQTFEKHWGLGNNTWIKGASNPNAKLNAFSYSRVEDIKTLGVTI